jgi:hypothetical protein
MKKLKMALSMTIAAAAFLILIAGAQPSVAEEISEADALNTANVWASLASKGDISGLETLLNERYIHIHGTALVETKAQFIDALKTGTRKYDPIRIEEPSARVFGSFAIVTGKFNLKAYTRGRTVEGVNRFSMVIIKTPTGLQVVSFQGTLIPQQK